MKHTGRMTNIILATAVLAITACGSYDRSEQINSFQAQSRALVGSISGNVTRALRSNSKGLRGVNDFSTICLPGYTANCNVGTTPVPVSYHQSSHEELTACQTALNVRQQNLTGAQLAQDFLPSMAIYASCLDRILVDSNRQLFALAFAHMDPQTQSLFSGLLNPRNVQSQSTDMMGFLFGMGGNNNMFNN